MPGTVPGPEIQQGANRQKLCPLRSFIIVRELDKKPHRLRSTRWCKWYKDKSEEEGVECQREGVGRRVAILHPMVKEGLGK